MVQILRYLCIKEKRIMFVNSQSHCMSESNFQGHGMKILAHFLFNAGSVEALQIIVCILCKWVNM